MSTMIVTRELYAIGTRRYIDIDGRRVKVPWRYNRPMVSCSGLKTVFDYRVGDPISCTVETKVWEGTTYLILKTVSD